MGKKQDIDMNDVSLQEPSYDERIKKYKIKRNTIIVTVLVLIAAVTAGIIIYKNLKHYDDYTVLSSLDKENNDNSKFLKYKTGFLKYDNDGITYYDSSNKIVWQQSYEMKKPQVKVCGDYIGVANISSSQIYILDSTGLKNIIDTALAITEIEVSAVGACAVTLEDGQINYVRMYDVNGKMIYDIKKVIEGDGYPLNIAVSPNGTKLCVSYLYLDKTEPKSKLAFYNFSEVGKNEVEFLVGEFEYDDTVIPEVMFTGDNKLTAVGDNALLYFTMEQYPSLDEKTDISYEITQMVYDNGYIGLVHNNDSGKEAHTLEVYNGKGKRVLTYRYDEDFVNMCFMKDYIMMYNQGMARMINYMGGTRFEYKFDIPLQSIVWMSGKDRFVFVNTKTIQQVILK